MQRGESRVGKHEDQTPLEESVANAQISSGGFVQRGGLLAQRENLVLPVALRIEEGKVLRKRRIVPALREPA